MSSNIWMKHPIDGMVQLGSAPQVPVGPTVELVYGDIEGTNVNTNVDAPLIMEKNTIQAQAGVTYSCTMNGAFRWLSAAVSADVIWSAYVDLTPSGGTPHQRICEARQLKVFDSNERSYVTCLSVFTAAETGEYEVNIYGKMTTGTAWSTLTGPAGNSWRVYGVQFTPLYRPLPT